MQLHLSTKNLEDLKVAISSLGLDTWNVHNVRVVIDFDPKYMEEPKVQRFG